METHSKAERTAQPESKNELPLSIQVVASYVSLCTTQRRQQKRVLKSLLARKYVKNSMMTAPWSTTLDELTWRSVSLKADSFCHHANKKVLSALCLFVIVVLAIYHLNGFKWCCRVIAKICTLLKAYTARFGAVARLLLKSLVTDIYREQLDVERCSWSLQLECCSLSPLYEWFQS